MRGRLSAAERIERWVEKIPIAGCWLYMGGLNKDGYGLMYNSTEKKNRRMMMAHRFIFEHYKRKIPDGMQIDHLCRIPSCCNPEHLDIVTPKENIARSPRVLEWKQKTHCGNGHELSGTNAYFHSRQRDPQCRICRADANRRSVAGRKL